MRILLAVISLSVSFYSNAAPSDFSKGPVFTDYGENAIIENGLEDAASQKFKVVFDVAEKNEQEAAAHRSLNTVARFINMHVRSGVPLENIEAAIVVHGQASFELMNDKAHQERFGKPSPSSELLQQLVSKGVQVFLCGQSASYWNITEDQLSQGVTMSLSAMTSNALLQQQGFTLNPF